MPTRGQTQVKSYPTPLISDVIFYEVLDLSQERYTDLNYEDPHYDKDRWPHHRIVSIQYLPDQDEKAAVFYAADRKHQDLYNFEHSKADLGGHKFDTVTRSYVFRRETYNQKTPALGTAMPDTPTGMFLDSAGAPMGYHLIARSQDRISQRGARAEATIGQAELDSVYIVEVRTYIDREEIITSSVDHELNGLPLFTRSNIYIRGESYSNVKNAASVTIQVAAATASYWGVTTTGKTISFTQVSDDVWIETVQDLIPQAGLSAASAKFTSGIVLRVYETSQGYSWPTVLGSDGVPEGGATANEPIETMDWVMKDGATRNFSRPRVKRPAKSQKTYSIIHQEWHTQATLDAIPSATLDVIETMNPRAIYYPSPILQVNIPSSLHVSGAFVSDTGTTDPKFAQNSGSTRTYPATTNTDWPNSIIADLDIKPWRSGYLVTHVTIYNPDYSVP